MKTKSGFTLNELFAVIAIIASLTAILFPVFARAREGEKANQAICISNLKKIGQAFIQYKEDFNNTYPLLYVGPVTSGTYKYWTQLLIPYMTSPRFFNCPSDSETLLNGKYPADIYPDGVICKMSDGTYTTQISSYAYNQNIAAKNESNIPNSANIFINWDCMNFMYHYGTSYCANPEPNGYDRMRTYKNDGSNWQWSRHNEGDNYSFCDGHVKWFKRSAVPSNNTSSAVNNPALNDPRWGDNL